MSLRLTVLALSFTSMTCLADDSVRLTYRPGYPPPGVSTTHADVVVSRTFEWKGAKGEIDLYFGAVAELIDLLEKQKDCGPMPIHAPTVTVNVNMGSRHFRRECAVEKSRIPVFENATPQQLAQNQAFEQLLRLTIERSNAMFAK
jgi:hypothetical protein